jgi:hypothetical protein
VAGPTPVRDDDCGKRAQRAHGREAPGEPTEERHRALAAAGWRLRGAGRRLREPRPKVAEPGAERRRLPTDRLNPTVEVPGGSGLEQSSLVSPQELLGVLDRARRDGEVGGRDDVPRRRHLLGRRAEPRGVGLGNVGGGDAEQGPVDDEAGPLLLEEAGVLDELGQRAFVAGSGARSSSTSGPTQVGRRRRSAAGRRAETGKRAAPSRWLRARSALVRDSSPQAGDSAPARCSGDAALVVEEHVEARTGQSPDHELRLGHHRAERGESVRSAISPNTSPGPSVESCSPAPSPAAEAERIGQHRRPTVLDHVESVGPVTLPDDRLTRREVHLLELAGQPCQVQAPQVGEEGDRASAIAESGRAASPGVL